MEEKRSRGVTFFGWYFIITNIQGMFHMRDQFQYLGLGRFIFCLLLSGAYLICGVYLLKLREPARKAVIILSVVSIIFLFFILNSIHFIKSIRGFGFPELLVPIVILIVLCIPIYFFTRPEVKEQFK